MGDLTKNFSRWEFACNGENCCEHSSPISLQLIDCIQKLRDIIGKAISVNCGFRCNKHNTETPGAVPDSQHTLGLAADLDTPDGITDQQFAKFAEMIPEFLDGGIGIYPGRIHVDIRKTGKARWISK